MNALGAGDDAVLHQRIVEKGRTSFFFNREISDTEGHCTSSANK
jgi:hypothetical protein